MNRSVPGEKKVGVNGFGRATLGGISDVSCKLSLKPYSQAVTDDGFLDWQRDAVSRGRFCSDYIVENVPGTRLRNDLLGLYVMSVDGIEDQRKALRQVQMRHRCPGAHKLLVSDGKCDDRCAELVARRQHCVPPHE